MRFGVILCPNCKNARGVVLGSKTTSCTKCGKKINLNKARLLVKVNSEFELVQAVGKINMKISNGEEIYQMDLRPLSETKNIREREKERRAIYEGIADRLCGISGKDNRIKMAAKELFMKIGDFTQDDYYEVLRRLGFNDEDEMENQLTRLLETDVIYQPKNGIYRYLGE